MNSLGTKYTFLPWLKTGIGANINVNEQDLQGPRATITVNLNVLVNSTREEPVSKEDIAIYGPGDVAGFLRNMILRIEPKTNESIFEPNYLAFIEFSQADFPWRMTPARPQPGGPQLREKLSPWIVLIVLKKDEFETLPIVGEVLLPQIRITKSPLDSLPNLKQSWAWAHCQLTAEIKNEEEEEAEDYLESILDNQPYKVISRIVCPRRLEQDTKYYAFVVPSFEVGRLAGIGSKVPEGKPGTDFAWSINGSEEDEFQKDPRLPVYYQWEFSTGEAGDFEDLVRRLEPNIANTENIGLRKLDVSDPYPVLDGVIEVPSIKKPLSLGGALWSLAAKKLACKRQIDVESYSVKCPDLESTTREEDEEQIRAFVMAMKELLDTSEKLTWIYARRYAPTSKDPIVTLPIYGKWHSSKRIISRISEDYQDPNWIRDLYNNPPPLEQVQKRKEWEKMIEYISKLKGDPPYRWLEELSLDPVNRVAAGLGVVIVQDLQEELMESAWDQVGVVNEANKRLRIDQLGRVLSKNVFERTLKVMSGHDYASRDILIQFASPLHDKIIVQAAENKSVSSLLSNSPIPTAFFSPSFKKISSRRGKIHRKLFDSDDHISSGLLEAYNKPGSNSDPHLATNAELPIIDRIFKEFYPPSDPFHDVTEGMLRGGGEEPSEEESSIPTEDQSEYPIPQVNPINLDRIADKIIHDMDPDIVIDTKISLEITKRPSRLDEDKKDKLDPIVAYPKFKRPMFEPLRDMSQNLLLPGVGDLPKNTLTLLVPNTGFIRSYMVGLNHAMAEELLWREYPTDRRGTYFRQFWDPSMAIEAERQETMSRLERPLSEQEEDEIVKKHYDIKEIHTWGSDFDLGDSRSNGGADPLENQSFLLVKGDLLRKYPDVVIYASKADFVTPHDGTRIISDPEKIEYPIFRGKIEPDIVFLGFDIAEKDLRGDDNQNAGWYFVIQEQPSEPRFGIDEQGTRPMQGWHDLGWNDVAKYPSGYIDIENTESLPGTEFDDPLVRWGSNAAAMAYITLQKPYRRAVHAKLLLP